MNVERVEREDLPAYAGEPEMSLTGVAVAVQDTRR